MKFDYEYIAKQEDVRKHIQNCESCHTQQAIFSTFHDGLTQVCFGCRKIRSLIIKHMRRVRIGSKEAKLLEPNTIGILSRSTYSSLPFKKVSGGTLTLKKLGKIYKKASAIYGDTDHNLYYRGIPVKLRGDMPTGEVWFVNENNFIIKKVPMGKKLNLFERWYIVIKTKISEWLGWGKNPPAETWLDWGKIVKQRPRRHGKLSKST